MKNKTSPKALLISCSTALIVLLTAGGCTQTNTTPPVSGATTAYATGAPPTVNEVDDVGIAQRVKAAIAADTQVNVSNLTSTAYLRVVYLTGVAGSLAEKNRITALARAIPGVVDVTNNMTVKP